MGKRLSKIYTRTGDDGSTGLGDGTRVAKDDARVEAYGTPKVTQAAPAAITVGMQHLQLLVGLVWRAILMWGGLIALVGFTSWIS